MKGGFARTYLSQIRYIKFFIKEVHVMDIVFFIPIILFSVFLYQTSKSLYQMYKDQEPYYDEIDALISNLELKQR